MTGAYLRVNRNSAWENIEVEYLTDDERKAIFAGRTANEIFNWLNVVCNTLAAVSPTARGEQE